MLIPSCLQSPFIFTPCVSFPRVLPDCVIRLSSPTVPFAFFFFFFSFVKGHCLLLLSPGLQWWETLNHLNQSRRKWFQSFGKLHNVHVHQSFHDILLMRLRLNNKAEKRHEVLNETWVTSDIQFRISCGEIKQTPGYNKRCWKGRCVFYECFISLLLCMNIIKTMCFAERWQVFAQWLKSSVSALTAGRQYKVGA